MIQKHKKTNKIIIEDINAQYQTAAYELAS